jgi:hypothetical protein
MFLGIFYRYYWKPTTIYLWYSECPHTRHLKPKNLRFGTHLVSVFWMVTTIWLPRNPIWYLNDAQA